jgi:hypothetical protein
MAYLPRIVATFPKAEHVLLVGVSAGGVGVAFNWWYVQQAFGTGVRVDMIDDSGPAFPAPYLTPSLVSTWESAWHLEENMPPGCTECQTSLDALVTYGANAAPLGKGALVEYMQDTVFPGFLSISTAEFTQGLDVLAKTRLDPLPRFRYFFVSQAGHVMLPYPNTAQNGVKLGDWLTQMVGDDPAWASVHP